MNHHKKSLKNNEQGLAAIVVTIFVMVMLSLVVLSFSQISRREQRQSLDRQLSSQAFYSAEAGINDVVKQIRSKTLPDLDRTQCTPGTTLDIAKTTAYSCVLFDRAPNQLIYRLPVQETQIISLKTETNDLNDLTITWNGANTGTNYAVCPVQADIGKLPNKDYTCPAGMLRVGLMLVDNASLSQDQLADNTFTIYLRPLKSSESPAPTQFTLAPDSQGAIVGAKCTDGGKCSATIQRIPRKSAFMHIQSIYQSNDVEITGTDATGATVEFNDAQIMVDSTGRSQDVLKRLQVRVPLYETHINPAFAVNILSGICKQLDVFPDKVTSSSICKSDQYFN